MQCESGYYILAEGTCEKIDSFDMCLVSDGIINACLVCVSQLVLDHKKEVILKENGRCEIYFDKVI